MDTVTTRPALSASRARIWRCLAALGATGRWLRYADSGPSIWMLIRPGSTYISRPHGLALARSRSPEHAPSRSRNSSDRIMTHAMKDSCSGREDLYTEFLILS